MVKNWLILGDDAFDSNDIPMGLLRFSQEEVRDWQSIYQCQKCGSLLILPVQISPRFWFDYLKHVTRFHHFSAKR